MRATVQWGVLHGLTHAVDVLRKSTGLPCAAVQMGPVTIGTLMCAHKDWHDRSSSNALSLAKGNHYFVRRRRGASSGACRSRKRHAGQGRTWPHAPVCRKHCAHMRASGVALDVVRVARLHACVCVLTARGVHVGVHAWCRPGACNFVRHGGIWACPCPVALRRP